MLCVINNKFIKISSLVKSYTQRVKKKYNLLNLSIIIDNLILKNFKFKVGKFISE